MNSNSEPEQGRTVILRGPWGEIVIGSSRSKDTLENMVELARELRAEIVSKDDDNVPSYVG